MKVSVKLESALKEMGETNIYLIFILCLTIPIIMCF